MHHAFLLIPNLSTTTQTKRFNLLKINGYYSKKGPAESEFSSHLIPCFIFHSRFLQVLMVFSIICLSLRMFPLVSAGERKSRKDYKKTGRVCSSVNRGNVYEKSTKTDEIIGGFWLFFVFRFAFGLSCIILSDEYGFKHFILWLNLILKLLLKRGKTCRH